ncbi:MAG TPA: ABC transporter ATP-binding protein [Candidatus Limnocylindria bacterium]|nr:ABC transporter ATP-binding protein [Candidatus Limnocylindria bacterium]
MESIVLADVSKRFDSVTAVDNVSFTVAPGELLTLLGPSGCGKTTTMRLIAGLERGDDGQIRVGDLIVSDARRGLFLPPEKRHIGMVFQSYAIWPHMTVFQNVAYPLKVRGVGRAEIESRVLEALALVELSGYESRPATKLSGGQQQRVALARAIVFRPAVLLLDEPLSNLDAKLRSHMRLELRRLQQQTGITTVYVTHDQTESMSLSDHIVVMRAGRIEQIGEPRALYERPRTEFVADFVGSANRMTATVVAADPTGVRLAVAEAGAELEALRWNDLPLAVSDPVLAVVRPERVRVAPAGGALAADSGMTHWRGKVDLAVYSGDRREYRIRIGELVLHAVTMSEVEVARGDLVDVAIAAHDVIVLPAPAVAQVPA